MGVFGRLASLFGGKGGSATGDHGEPIVIKWPPDDSAAGESGSNGHGDDVGGLDITTRATDPDDILPIPAPPAASRAPSRQELIDELRQNYREVIDLVRKVNTHLDQQADRVQQQDERAERLLAAAERLTTAVEDLPRLREQAERLGDLSTQTVAALNDLSQHTREGHSTIAEAVAEQGRSAREYADRAEALLTRTAEAQDASARSAADLAAALGNSSDRLTTVLAEIQQRSSDREAHLAEMIARGQRWFMIVAGLCTGAIIVTGVVIALVVRGQ